MIPDVALDTILHFAAQQTTTLHAGLALLNAAPRSVIPSTHRHVIRRLVPVRVLGVLGDLTVLHLLPSPLMKDDLGHLSRAAAAAGNVHVLDWICSQPQHMGIRTALVSDPMPSGVFSAALKHSQLGVLDWCVENGSTFPPHVLDHAFKFATSHGQARSLGWLKAHASKLGVGAPAHPFTQFFHMQNTTVENQLAALDWWKAEYVARNDLPSLRLYDDDKFPVYLARTSTDGRRIVDWWRAYCREMGRDFQWPPLDKISATTLVFTGNLALCQWWLAHSLQHHASYSGPTDLIAGLLETMCEQGKVGFLDWYWDMALDPSVRGINVDPRWRPHRPFAHMSVIRWWEAKVSSGAVSPRVFELPDQQQPRLQRRNPLEHLFQSLLRCSSLSLPDPCAALEWWCARWEPLKGLVAIAPNTWSELVQIHLGAFQWYLDCCTNDTRLPVPSLTMHDLASMVARGRPDLLDRLWRLHMDRGLPLTLFEPATGGTGHRINVSHFIDAPAVPLTTVLDTVQAFCTRAGVPLVPRDHLLVESVLVAMEADDLAAARWWYAMHVVHGTPFLTREELEQVAGSSR
ncbi:hypothetical protein BC828DRAFT_404877 [Blastocladiella britannica]|nr:hypothetical protein BC828DRAFT_404877 [Blastocladiella britannica]